MASKFLPILVGIITIIAFVEAPSYASGFATNIIFLGILLLGVAFITYRIQQNISQSDDPSRTIFELIQISLTILGICGFTLILQNIPHKIINIALVSVVIYGIAVTIYQIQNDFFRSKSSNYIPPTTRKPFQPVSSPTYPVKIYENEIGMVSHSSLRNPTAEDIRRLIERISEDFLFLRFWLVLDPHIHITVDYIFNSERVALNICTSSDAETALDELHNAFLVDETLIDSTQFVEYDTGQDLYEIPLFYTVTRERAIEICTHFLHSTQIPSGTTWGWDEKWDKPDTFRRY